MDYETFLNLHDTQLKSSGVPDLYWKTILEKIQNQIFDAGETFQLLKFSYEGPRLPHEPVYGLQTISTVDTTEPRHIYLVDHFWTFRVGDSRQQLEKSEKLRTRLANIIGLEEATPEGIFQNMWKYCHTYSIKNAATVEDGLPIWYIMDEIGSSLLHNNNPYFRIVPFFSLLDQVTYSLLFPCEQVQEEEFVCVDFAEGLNGEQKSAALLPWAPSVFKHQHKPVMPALDYYITGHVKESLPDPHPAMKMKNKYLVYTQYDLIATYLTDKRFEITDNETKADVLWYNEHFTDYNALDAEKIVNQFPFEYILTNKDLLAVTCRKFLNAEETLECLKFFPVTYNLKTEIANFVSYFQHRESQQLDNYWIVKPYNLARSLDTYITDNLDYLMRLAVTGPKIAQKYITKPVLFQRACGLVKFDVRYVILLKSVQPLQVYVYRNFFVRFANKPFALNSFDDYERHFTVMNYDENFTLKHMLCAEFENKWQEQYGGHEWSVLERKIFDMLLAVFKCATRDKPPMGLGHSAQSRAVYAADLMLEWVEDGGIQPKLLEINWSPDCERACEYYPDFYNGIFKVLLLNEICDDFVQL